jgi:hypothetical protein
LPVKVVLKRTNEAFASVKSKGAEEGGLVETQGFEQEEEESVD